MQMTNDNSCMQGDMSNAYFAAQNGQNGFAPKGAVYSEMNMKSTVVGLSNVIAVMQQQHACMESKQDSITSTLTNVMSLLQTLTNNAQNVSQNNYTGAVQNDGPTSAYNASAGQNVQLHDGAGGDQEMGREAHDTAAGRDTTTFNAVPIDQRSTVSQTYRYYERDTRDEQADRTGYEDRGRDYYDNTSVNQSQDKHRRPPRVQWREAEYDPSERRSDNSINSRI